MRFVLASVAISASLLGSGCIDPDERRPGLWLSGEVATETIDDWSFTDAYSQIFVETKTRYLIPHSTTIACAADGAALYVAAREPSGKRWVENITRDPDVRLQIGDRIYERRLAKLDLPSDRRAAHLTYAAKYGWPETPERDAPEVWYYRVVPRD